MLVIKLSVPHGRGVVIQQDLSQFNNYCMFMEIFENWESLTKLHSITCLVL